MDWLANIQSAGNHAYQAGHDGHRLVKMITRKPPPSPIDLTARLDPQEAAHYQFLDAKPPYSYAALIAFAINSTSRRRMTLNDIYTWICNHFPYYREAGTGWKVMHLSDSKYFTHNSFVCCLDTMSLFIGFTSVVFLRFRQLFYIKCIILLLSFCRIPLDITCH